jgi:BASS family bile acid:Na+ symporter
MREGLAQVASVAVLVFAVTSMASVGLSYRLADLVRPLCDARGVLRALVANFVLIPLLAVGIVVVVPLEPPLALGLFLLAGSAGAPFLVKLASAARDDVALGAALLLLLVPATVAFLPLYVPWAMAHPSLRGLSYVPSSVLALGLPLVSTLVLPLAAGLVTRAVAPRLAAGLAPIGGRASSVVLVVVVASTFGANVTELVEVVTSGAIVAGVLLTLGAFAVGVLVGRPERRGVLGLGTAQRNVAGALVIASRDFDDPDILVMITATVLAGLALLFPIAWLLARRPPGLGPPTADGVLGAGRGGGAR